MQIKRIFAWLLCLAGLAALPFAAESAEGQPQETAQYLVYLSEDPGTAGDVLTAVPYAEGYYTADSLLDVLPLMAEGSVELLVRNEELELLYVPNDPELSSQWYLDTLGMNELWDTAYTGEGVTVAVIDSGLYFEHEEFADASIIGHNFLGSGDHPEAYGDDSGHGTLVTGVLAAGRDNDVGGTGLTPQVTVMPLRCFSANPSASANSGHGKLDTVVAAIGWAIEHHADVINMSLGGTGTDLLGMEPILQEAADAGILTVAAVGNKGQTTLYYPAAFDCVTGVGWTDRNDEISPSSQHNASVYVSAPGSSIYGPGILTSGAYRTDSGTSFATPMVSALAVMAKQTDRAIDYEGFQQLLRQCARDKGAEGWDEYYGYGVISVRAFVSALEAPQAIVYQHAEGIAAAETWPQTYRIGHGEEIALPDGDEITLEGDTFLGWYLDEEFTDALTSIPAGSVGTVILYAKWVSDTVTQALSGLTVRGADAQKTGLPGPEDPDWTILLPKEQEALSLTAEDIILFFQDGESAAAAALNPVEGTEGLWQVDTKNGRQLLQVRFSEHGTPTPVQPAITGTAAPASSDGEIPAVPFSAVLADLFRNANEYTTYSVETTAGAGSALVRDGTLSYIPTADDAGTTVTLTVRAENPDGFSGTVSVTVAVGTIPLGDSDAEIRDIQISGSDITVRAVCRENGASLWCAVYRETGRMIAVINIPVVGDGNEQPYHLDVKTTKFSYAKAFVLNGALKPLCESRQTSVP